MHELRRLVVELDFAELAAGPVNPISVTYATLCPQV